MPDAYFVPARRGAPGVQLGAVTAYILRRQRKDDLPLLAGLQVDFRKPAQRLGHPPARHRRARGVGHIELHDLGSTNGTYLDGVRVSRAVLRNGAVINVPAQVFAFTGGMLHYHAHQSGISIQLVNVYKTVKNANTGKPLNIVDGTSFQVEPNSFVVLVGGSGTGKSSLLTCITGTAPCTAGSVKFDGLDTRSNRNAFEAALGYVPQKDIMHDSLTVEQSLTYTAKLRIAHDATRAEIAAAVAHAIEAVDLQGREKTFISKLSGGQKQRVAIARALVLNPKILLCDEATSALDPQITKGILALLLKINKELGITIVVVTHQMEVVKEICNKVAFLKHGKMIATGKPEELFVAPNKDVQEFVGDSVEFLPKDGVNVRLFFNDETASDSAITHLAHELGINFGICQGKLENFRGTIMGSLVINVTEADRERVTAWLTDRGILWEVLENV